MQDNYRDEAIKYANSLLDTPMTPDELTRCLRRAKIKLDWILQFTGDCNEERLEPYYFGALIAEKCLIARDFGGMCTR